MPDPKTPPNNVLPLRKRAPTYDVWLLLGHGPGDPVRWEEVALFVAAPNRREAIRVATADLPEDQRYGTFAVVRSGEISVETRTKRVETHDDWT